MLWAAALVLVAGDLLGASELRDIGESDDARAAYHLEQALEARVGELERFPVSLPPPDLEEEIAAALFSLERLEPARALAWARTILESPTSDRVAAAARRVLARAGDARVVAVALQRYFSDPELSRGILGDAAAATGDARLRDFVAYARPRREPTPALLRSRVARALGETTETPSPASLQPLLQGEAERADVLVLPPRERHRAIRFLATRDPDSLAGLPMSSEIVDRLYPYLALSSRRELRDRVRRARTARGRGLASLLLSPRVDRREKRGHADAMRDAWLDAVAAAGRDVVTPLVGAAAVARAIDELPPSPGLIHLDSHEARVRLERAATPTAIRWLGRRPDTVLALPALLALRARNDDDVRRAAQIELLRLGAPGSSTWLQSQLRDEAIAELVPAALDSPVDAEIVTRAVERVASRDGPEPVAMAAITRVRERYPRRFGGWLHADDVSLRERAQFVMALSGDPRRLPLLIELAVFGRGAVRDAAFRGLAEANLGDFDKRLHRLAGDPDRSVRFQTAVALVPTGTEWAFRLLLAELDESHPIERLRAKRAIERLPPEETRTLLQTLIENGTATPFAVELFLELGAGRDLDRWRERLWEVLAPHVELGEPAALVSAARLSHPEATAAVERYLGRR